MSIRKQISMRVRAWYDGHTHPEHIDHEKYNAFANQTVREIMSNKLHAYEYYKNLYESVKPIRGRVEQVRPIGQRRRDWETVNMKGDVVVCTLYQTDVVKYYPDGSIGLQADTWFTPLTAEFMYTHSPFYCYKKYNKLWVRIQGNSEDKHFPVPRDGELRLVPTDESTWNDPKAGWRMLPSEPIVIQQRVVDKDKAKNARAKMQPFLNWVKVMIKLSDGWVLAETKMQVAKPDYQYWRVRWVYDLPRELSIGNYGHNYDGKAMYEYLSNLKDEDYLPVYLYLTEGIKNTERRLYKEVQYKDEHGNNRNLKIHDEQINFEQFKRVVYKIADDANDIHKMVEREVGDGALTNVA